MSKATLKRRINGNSRFSVANLILIATTFIWYFLAFSFINDTVNDLKMPYFVMLKIVGLNVIGIAASAMLMASLLGRIKRRYHFLCGWLIAGGLLSLLPMILPMRTETGLTLVSAIFGVYFGLGMPTTMGLFAQFTEYENRAKLAGITFLVIGLGWFLLGNIVGDSVQVFSVLLSIIRWAGFVPFFLFGIHLKREIPPEKNPTYRSIIKNRTFLLYFVPWIAFSLVNFITLPFSAKLGQGEQFINLSMVMENVLVAASAVATGFLAGVFGRRRLTISGFIMIGLGYGVLGLSSVSSGLTSTIGLIFYTISDGVAWGIFYVIFLFTLWGDIAQHAPSEKFYVIGALPYVLSSFAQLLLQPLISPIPETAIFSLASFILFLGVPCLFFAPETLPEDMMRNREMNLYIAQAEKIKQKYS